MLRLPASNSNRRRTFPATPLPDGQSVPAPASPHHSETPAVNSRLEARLLDDEKLYQSPARSLPRSRSSENMHLLSPQLAGNSPSVGPVPASSSLHQDLLL
eukprot:TRINITY_DN10364_c0_g1_i6.p2 TRINITY_DN10364_c0_g1~~TRINITY_DN10364_c0_g1_i6.p2  ORF type:complete len:101 (+),score=25.59 TRINITY_DN10364_c0_g1_i6:191-493(+)